MFNYTVRRVLQMIPLLLAITFVIFALVSLQPGDPIDNLVQADPRITPEDVARLRAAYGLDQPIWQRYITWLGLALQGDLGYSRTYFMPAAEYIFRDRLPNTLLLSGTAYLLSLLLAIPLGIYSALRQYSVGDYFLTFISFVGLSVPVFWLGIMLIYLFAVQFPTMGLSWLSLPPGGIETPGLVGFAPWWEVWLDRARYLLLPAATLAFVQIAGWTRYLRANLLEVMNQDYVRTAKAKGLAPNVVTYKHALRNAMIPMITLFGLAIPALLGGAVLTETVFSWPGMGRAILEGLVNKDFNIVMAALTFLALMTVVFNLLADLAYGLADPRIRYN